MKALFLSLILSCSVLAEVPSKGDSVTYDFDCNGVEMSVIETDMYIGEVYTFVSSSGFRRENMPEWEGKALLKDLRSKCNEMGKVGEVEYPY